MTFHVCDSHRAESGCAALQGTLSGRDGEEDKDWQAA